MRVMENVMAEELEQLFKDITFSCLTDGSEIKELTICQGNNKITIIAPTYSDKLRVYRVKDVIALTHQPSGSNYADY